MDGRAATTRLVGDFARSRRAVIAVEFAIFLPIMMVLWLGLVEFGSAHLVGKKVEMAAQSVADIIAQRNTIDSTELPDFQNAIDAIIAPFPTGTVGYQIVNVVADSSDVASVSWYYPASATPPSVPSEAQALVDGDDSVVIVTVTYTHTPWPGVRYVVGDVSFSETMYAKPRLVATISCTNGCPSP